MVNCAAMDTLDIAVRLGAATLVGVLSGSSAIYTASRLGVRTLGLVCLGSALAVLSIHAVDRHRREPRDPGHRGGRRISRRGRDCSKRERPSRARTHHGGLRLGDRVHRCSLRDCAVADRRDGRCGGAGYSRVRRAVRGSGRPALAEATGEGFGSTAGQNAYAWREDVKEIPLS